MAEPAARTVLIFALIVLISALVSSATKRTDKKTSKSKKVILEPPPKCVINTFKDIVKMYIKLGERWQDPVVYRRDKRRRIAQKRKELLSAMLTGYCEDDELDENQVYAMDECFAIAFDADLDIVTKCRKFNFYTADQLKLSDCTEDDTRESVAFKECVNHKMKERKPEYDLYDGLTEQKAIERREMTKFLKKATLRCFVRVLHNYYEDYRERFYD